MWCFDVVENSEVGAADWTHHFSPTANKRKNFFKVRHINGQGHGERMYALRAARDGDLRVLYPLYFVSVQTVVQAVWCYERTPARFHHRIHKWTV